MHVRRHGSGGPVVIVLHGGPAAAGEAAPIARGLAGEFLALEPWQRGSGEEPPTVARHIADLHDLVLAHSTACKPALVGESWGAMLALAYAAAHPTCAGPLALIGCGSFDTAARERMHEILAERQDETLRRRLRELRTSYADPQERLKRHYELTRSLYDYDPIPAPDQGDEIPPLDIRAHTETWEDMVRLQEEGVYPATFTAITSSVLMLHGVYDPHPGRMIRAGLEPFLPQLEYHEWECCGHSPWKERAVREAFFDVLRAWLHRHLGT